MKTLLFLTTLAITLGGHQEQNIVKDLRLISIDTVPPYYRFRFVQQNGSGIFDSLTVLSRTHPVRKMSITDSVDLIQLEIGKMYSLELAQINSVLTSDNAKIETFLNGRAFYLNDKILVPRGHLPFMSKNLYKSYYLKPK